MPFSSRIDRALRRAVEQGQGPDAPARLASALHYATTPGGARIRPTILLAVATACGEDRPEIADAAAVALELVHCASLVHDDLPCFDNAELRRGKPTVHRAYSEPLAVLTGDSLIFLAFEVLAQASGKAPDRGLDLLRILAAKSGMPGGICAGQGWESEERVDLTAYHRSKTGALFVAATQMGAVAAGQDPSAWYDLGDRIGAAFQVADDLRDACLSQAELGKPVGQDDLHARPNAVRQLGVSGAMRYLKDTLSAAIASIPSCPGEARLAEMMRAQAQRITPQVPAHLQD